MATAQQVLDVARSQIGYVEGPNNWTKYSAEVDSGKYQWQAWCGSFVRWVTNLKCGMNEPSPVWTPGGAESYARMNRWAPRNAPQVGAVVFFDWGQSQTRSRIDHVGLVESVESGQLVCIEGNTSDADWSNGGAVMRRRRSLQFVVGYGLPQYSASAPTPPPNIDWAALRRMAAAKLINDGVGTISVIRLGSSGNDVRLWQQALNLVSDAKLAEDGSFGQSTLRKTIDFQRWLGLKSVDGIVGPETRFVMGAALNKIRNGG
jgi:hypothetical protein